jgi:hypothetical protein
VGITKRVVKCASAGYMYLKIRLIRALASQTTSIQEINMKCFTSYSTGRLQLRRKRLRTTNDRSILKRVEKLACLLGWKCYASEHVIRILFGANNNVRPWD